MAKFLSVRNKLFNEIEAKFFGKHVRHFSRSSHRNSDTKDDIPLNNALTLSELVVNKLSRVYTEQNAFDKNAFIAKRVYFGVQSIRVLKGRHSGKANLYTLFVSAFVSKRQHFITQQYFYANTADPKNTNKLWFLRMNILHLPNFHNREEIIKYWNMTNTECGTHLFLDHTYSLQTITNNMRSDRSLVTSPRAYINEVVPQFSETGRYIVARKYMISAGVRDSDGFRVSSRFDRMLGIGGVFDLRVNDILNADSKLYIKKYLDPEVCTDLFAVYVTDNAKLIVCDDLHQDIITKEYQKVLFGKYGDYIHSRTLFMERSLAIFEGTFCVSMCETGVYQSSERFCRLKRVKRPVFIVGEVSSKYQSLCWSVTRMNKTDTLYSGHKTDWCFRFPQNYNLIDIVEFDAFVDQCQSADNNYFRDCRQVLRSWPDGHVSNKTAAVIHCVDGIHSVRFDDLRFKTEKDGSERRVNIN